MIELYQAFLNARVDAIDSDIEALVERFNISEELAEEVYLKWLSTL